MEFSSHQLPKATVEVTTQKDRLTVRTANRK